MSVDSRPVVAYAISKFECSAESKLELSFRKNRVFDVLEFGDDGWWTARIDGVVGIVPKSYLHPAPPLDTLIHTIRTQFADVPDIFRAQPNDQEVAQVQQVFSKCANNHLQFVANLKNCNPHGVATYLKRVLKRATTPFIPFSLYNSMISLNVSMGGPGLGPNQVPVLGRMLFAQVTPLSKYVSLVSFFHMLATLQNISQEMIAYTFGPVILRPEFNTMETLTKHQKLVNNMVLFFLQNAEGIFGLKVCKSVQRPTQTPRAVQLVGARADATPPVPPKRSRIPRTSAIVLDGQLVSPGLKGGNRRQTTSRNAPAPPPRHVQTGVRDHAAVDLLNPELETTVGPFDGTLDDPLIDFTGWKPGNIRHIDAESTPPNPAQNQSSKSAIDGMGDLFSMSAPNAITPPVPPVRRKNNTSPIAGPLPTTAAPPVLPTRNTDVKKATWDSNITFLSNPYADTEAPTPSVQPVPPPRKTSSAPQLNANNQTAARAPSPSVASAPLVQPPRREPSAPKHIPNMEASAPAIVARKSKQVTTATSDSKRVGINPEAKSVAKGVLGNLFAKRAASGKAVDEKARKTVKPSSTPKQSSSQRAETIGLGFKKQPSAPAVKAPVVEAPAVKRTGTKTAPPPPQRRGSVKKRRAPPVPKPRRGSKVGSGGARKSGNSLIMALKSKAPVAQSTVVADMANSTTAAGLKARIGTNRASNTTKKSTSAASATSGGGEMTFLEEIKQKRTLKKATPKKSEGSTKPKPAKGNMMDAILNRRRAIMGKKTILEETESESRASKPPQTAPRRSSPRPIMRAARGPGPGSRGAATRGPPSLPKRKVQAYRSKPGASGATGFLAEIRKGKTLKQPGGRRKSPPGSPPGSNSSRGAKQESQSSPRHTNGGGGMMAAILRKQAELKKKREAKT